MVRGTMGGVMNGSVGEARVAMVLRSKVTFSRAREVGRPRGGGRPGSVVLQGMAHRPPGCRRPVPLGRAALLGDNAPEGMEVAGAEPVASAAVSRILEAARAVGAQGGGRDCKPGAKAQALVLQVGAMQPEQKQQILWHLFQNSATAMAQLCKGRVCQQPGLSPLVPLQHCHCQH